MHSHFLTELLQTDSDLFLWINQHHCTATDWVLWVASQHWSWAIVLILAFLFSTLRHEPNRWWIVLIGIVLCFLFADRTSVIIKNIVCRPRPCHALEDVRMFHTSCGGAYGFISSHAANVFALAMFLTLRYCKSRNNSPRVRQYPALFPILIFLWAVLVGYSRPYLGKHYPGDVICGALWGMALGFLVFLLTHLVDQALQNRTKEKKVATK